MAILTVGTGGTYSTLQAAHNAANPGDTLRLLSNLSGASATVKVTKNNITIDLNNFELDGQHIYPTGAIVKSCDTNVGTKHCDCSNASCESVGHTWLGIIQDNGSTGLIVRNGTVRRSSGNGVLLNQSSNTLIQNVNIQDCRHSAARTVRSTDATFDGGDWGFNVNYMPCSRDPNDCNFPGNFSTNEDVNLTIRNVTVHDGWGSGIIILRCTNATIEYNKTYNLWRPGLNMSGSNNSVFRGNYVVTPNGTEYGSTYAGIALFPETEGGAPSNENITVENNIVVGAAAGLWMSTQGTFANDGIQNLDINVRNNTFVNQTDVAIRVKKRITNMQIDNNIFVNTGSTKNAVDAIQNDTQTVTTSNNLWFGYTLNEPGYTDGTDVLSNPLLVDASNTFSAADDKSRYYLTSASPAINAANAGNAPTIDIQKNTRTTADIGAHEFAGTVAPGNEIPTECTGNILANNSFDSGTANWTDQTDGGFTVANGEATMSGTTGQAPFNQVFQDSLNVTAGQYRLQFVAKVPSGSNNTSLRLNLLQNNTPFNNLGLSEAYDLTTEYQLFETVFTVNANEADARLRFRFAEGTFFVSEICLEPFASQIEADFTPENQTVEIGEIIAFIDESTATNPITSYMWDFGDGNTSTVSDPFHSYATAGVYTVELTVSDGTISDTYSTTITVTGEIQADYTVNKNVAYVGEGVTFTDTSTSSSGITSYLWDFGDGSFSSQVNPTHSYASPGTYTTSLTVTGPDGSSTVILETIIVSAFEVGAGAIDSLMYWSDASQCYKRLTPAPGPAYVLSVVNGEYAWVIK